jgi:hypothetical protein
MKLARSRFLFNRSLQLAILGFQSFAHSAVELGTDTDDHGGREGQFPA